MTLIDAGRVQAPPGRHWPARAQAEHAGPMTERDKYAVSIDELVASANVPFDEQVQEKEADERPEHDEAAGHLPGNVRPYGA